INDETARTNIAAIAEKIDIKVVSAIDHQPASHIPETIFSSGHKFIISEYVIIPNINMRHQEATLMGKIIAQRKTFMLT
ncbi:MAG: hypothetical protein COB94_007575, partial [Gammaproteobacteria bacterium]|nr:hypothetical protein [Gammaproteobacteria bacterium]